MLLLVNFYIKISAWIDTFWILLTLLQKFYHILECLYYKPNTDYFQAATMYLEEYLKSTYCVTH